MFFHAVLLFLKLLLITSVLSDLTAIYLDTKLPRKMYRTSVIYDGVDNIYLFGGFNNASEIYDILCYSISKNTIELVGLLPYQNVGGTLQMDDTGNIFCIGGGDDGKGIYQFNIETHNLSRVDVTLPFNAKDSSSVKYNSTEVLIYGGIGNCEGIVSLDMEKQSSPQLLQNYSIMYCDSTAIAGHFPEVFIFRGGNPPVKTDMEKFSTVVLEHYFPQMTDAVYFPRFWLYAPVSDGEFVYFTICYKKLGTTVFGIYQFDLNSYEVIELRIEGLRFEGYVNDAPSAVYVEKENKIYFFGGRSEISQTPEKEFEYYDDIWYIDLSSINGNKKRKTDSGKANVWVWAGPLISIPLTAVIILTIVLIRRRYFKASLEGLLVNVVSTEIQEDPLPAINDKNINNAQAVKSVWKSIQPLTLFSMNPHGTGSFSSVYKAKSTLNPDKLFAVKRIPIYNALKHLQWDVEKVLREVKNLSEIDNENVIKLHNWWVEDPTGICMQNVTEQLRFHEWSSTQDYFMFVQMEFCDSTLREWLTRNETIEMRLQHDIGNILSQIINGLRGIHDKCILHRDIKPNNIFYCSQTNKWKIGDFGFSTKLNDSNEELTIIGCQSYRSPEMENSTTTDTDYSFKSDVFSLGLTFLEIVYKFSTVSFKTKIFDDIRSSTANVSLSEMINIVKEVKPEIVQLLTKMLVVNPDNRIDIHDPLIDNLLRKINK